MSRMLYLECSPHGEQSSGARILRAARAEAGAGLAVTMRCLAQGALEPVTARYARAITARDAPKDDVFAGSEALIRELEQCDGLFISTPMHNFTVPAALKLWIDYVLRIGRTFVSTPDGKAGLLADRPALVLVRAGGACTGEDARQPDFLGPYLRHVLLTLGIRNVQFSYLSGLPPTQDAWAGAQRAVAAFLDSLSPTGASA